MDALWQLELCQPLGEYSDQLRFGWNLALCYHSCDHAFAQIGMGNAKHRGFDHASQSVDLLFNLSWVNVEAAGDDDIPGPPDNCKSSLFIQRAYIAGNEITLPGEILVRPVRHSPITLADIGAFHLDSSN